MAITSQLYTKFRLSRMNISQHPVAAEDYLTRRCYFAALHAITKKDNMFDSYVKNALLAYKKIFGITDMDFHYITQSKLFEDNGELKKVVQVLKGSRQTKVKDKIEQKSFEYVLLANLFYLYGIDNKEVARKSYAGQMARHFMIPPKEYLEIIEFTVKLLRYQYDGINVFLKKSKCKLLEYFYESTRQENLFEGSPEHNVAIVASMSAGKSTLINSLVGYDLLPAKNLACTAKVIKLCHNSCLDRVIGYAAGTKNNFENFITRDIVEKWNEDDSVQLINLEINFPGLPPLKKKLYLIDTPGANNSTNQQCLIYLNRLLEQVKLHKILYILNGANLGCNDDFIFLRQIYQYCLNGNNFKPRLIFLLNKMDLFDMEKEDPNLAVSHAVEYVKKAGFRKPNVLAVSAYGAKLMKSVLNGVSLTKKETKDFQYIFRLFQNEKYDLTKCSHFSDLPPGFRNTAGNSRQWVDSNCELLVGNESYQKDSVIKALKSTGIMQIENIIHSS